MGKGIMSCLGEKVAIGITLIGITLGAAGCSNDCQTNIFPDPRSSGYIDEQRSAAGGHGIIWYQIFPPVY